MNRPLRDVDPEIAEIVELETRRQAIGLELIPSENLVSEAVLEAMGSVLTNKYAEGYPGKRYYGGCEFVDRAEQLAIDRAKQLFGAEHANVQAHSGTQANISVYMTALQPGDTVLGMNLAHGGHLTHGHPLNFSGIGGRGLPSRPAGPRRREAAPAVLRRHGVAALSGAVQRAAPSGAPPTPARSRRRPRLRQPRAIGTSATAGHGRQVDGDSCHDRRPAAPTP